MKLRETSRLVADARSTASRLDDAQLAGAALTMIVGYQSASPMVLAAGLAVLAFQLGRRTLDPERRYMEGFADGVTAGDTLAAADNDRRDERDLRVVPGGAGAVDPGEPDDRAWSSQRADRGAVEQPLDFAAMAGISLGDRPTRPSVGTFVDEPIRPRPRASDFGPTKADRAVSSRPPLDGVGAPRA